MESILIVDDEPLVLEGIRSKLDWEVLGFDRVETATDGYQALRLVEQSPPSVLLTDIRMPYLDGLALCKAVRTLTPETKIIIMTGHDEFPYAQDALRLGASDFVLKPVTAEELSIILQEVNSQLVRERSERRDLERLRAQLQESLPLLRERFLLRLLRGQPQHAEWTKQALAYSIDFTGHWWSILAVRVDHWRQAVESRGHEQGELLLLAIEAICREYARGFHHCQTLRGLDDELLVLVGSNNEAFEHELLAFGNTVRNLVAADLEVTVTIGVGRVVDARTPASLSDSYRDALTALEYRLLLGRNRIIPITDVEPQAKPGLFISAEQGHRLATAVRTGMEGGVDAAVRGLMDTLAVNLVPVDNCRMVVMHALTEILDAASGLGGNAIAVKMSGEMFADLQRQETLDEIGSWLSRFCRDLASQVNIRREYEVRVLVERAKAYIIEHYTDPDLSLQDVCNHLHISPSYFSLLFKREMCQTFLGFVTELRMNKAKELLTVTSLRSYEIAERIGFTDPNYFSQCFRKNCGISPQQYREQGGDNG